MKIRSLLLGSAALLLASGNAFAADAVKSYSKDPGCNFGDSYFSIGGGHCLDISGRVRWEYHFNQPQSVDGGYDDFTAYLRQRGVFESGGLPLNAGNSFAFTAPVQGPSGSQGNSILNNGNVNPADGNGALAGTPAISLNTATLAAGVNTGTGFNTDPTSGSEDLTRRGDFETSGRIDFSVLTGTEYGLLKSFLRLESLAGSASNNNNGTQAVEVINKAYIQFAGFTFGRTDTFFGFSQGLGADESNHATGGWDNVVDLAAYTFNVIDGTLITLSIEDRATRGFLHGSSGTVAGAASGSVRIGALGNESYTQKLPDFVVDVESTQDWGKWGISGAFTSGTYRGTVAAGNLGYTSTTNLELDNNGFAIAGGVQFNIPTDLDAKVTIRGTYTSNAFAYLGRAADFFVQNEGNLNGGQGNIQLGDVSGYDIGAGIDFGLTDTLRFNLAASYVDLQHGDIRNFGQGFNNNGTPTGDVGFRRADGGYAFSGTLYWTPVSNFTVALDAFYSNANGAVFENDLRQSGSQASAHLGNAYIQNDLDFDAVGGSITITRTF